MPLLFWMESGSNEIVTTNASNKIAVCRIIKNLANSNDNIGFLVVFIDEVTLRNMYRNSLLSSSESVLITDNNGNLVSHAGTSLPASEYKKQNYYKLSCRYSRGTIIDDVSGQKMLVNFSFIESTGWKTFYGVSLKSVTKQITSTGPVTFLIIVSCILLSLPLMLVISSYITAPLKKLLFSMKRFQEGNFDEKVGFKYPHFLYNTLDTIFWKAVRKGDTEISDIIFSLSKLFRLSLNSGKGFTMVLKEKELVEHYLLLLKLRFKSKLNYRNDTRAI